MRISILDGTMEMSAGQLDTCLGGGGGGSLQIDGDQGPGQERVGGVHRIVVQVVLLFGIPGLFKAPTLF